MWSCTEKKKIHVDYCLAQMKMCCYAVIADRYEVFSRPKDCSPSSSRALKDGQKSAS